MAVKTLHANLVNIPGFVGRFKREAKFAKSLEHDNVVPVFDFGQEQGYYYIAMAYMSGGSLTDYIKKNHPINENQVGRIFDQVANGVEFAHSQGIIHRDLKPGNILFDEYGNARIGDLGFAKAHFDDASVSLSMTGGMIGTPNYMAPELWEGKEATPETDQYSLGCILYEMLSGKKLFDGETTPTVMLNHFRQAKIGDTIPAGFREIITRATKVNSENRFQTLGDMRVAVDRLITHLGSHQQSSESLIGLGFGGDGGKTVSESRSLETDLKISPKQENYKETTVIANPVYANTAKSSGDESSIDPSLLDRPKKDKSKIVTVWLAMAIGLFSMMLIGGLIWIKKINQRRLIMAQDQTAMSYTLLEREVSQTPNFTLASTSTLTKTLTHTASITHTLTKTNSLTPTKPIVYTKTPTPEIGGGYVHPSDTPVPPVITHALAVIVTGNGSVRLSPPGGTYEAGTQVTLSAVAQEGWRFVNWGGHVSGSNNPITITISKDVTISAIFEKIPPQRFTVDVNVSGSGSVTPYGGTYDVGTQVTLTARPNEGYKFAGWSGDASGSTNPLTVTISKNMSITATFEKIPPEKLTLTVNVAGKGSVDLSPPGGTYDAGTKVTLTAKPDEGYQFVNWSEDASGSDNPLTVTVTEDMTIFATFEEIPPEKLTLTVNVVGKGSVDLSPPGGTYDAGTKVTLTAKPDEGYQFVEWSGDASCSDNPLTVTISKNMTITATFEEIPAKNHTLTVVVVGKGSVNLSPPSGKYDPNTQVTLTAKPEEGYQFVNWSGDASGSDNPLTVTISKDMTIIATFEEIPAENHTLTVVVVGNGSVTPNGGTYEAGTELTLTAKPDEGYKFVNWSGDASGSDNPLTVTISKDMTITATFEEIPPETFTLTVKVSGNGSVTPNGGTYEAGTELTLIAKPEEGYKFVNWSGDASGEKDTLTVTISKDMTITATFEKDP